MTAAALDSPETYARIDPEGLLGRIRELPAQFEEAWRAASALSLPEDYRDVERIVVLGMGGSGIGGALLRALAIDAGARRPVELVRGYTLPAYVDAGALVFGSSSSGDTEETVAAFGAALESGARCIAVTAGGQVGRIARAHGVPFLQCEWGAEPRAALGWSFASLLAISSRLGLIPDVASDLREGVASMRALVDEIGQDVPEASNAAKQMAHRFEGRLPVIIGGEALAPVAYRWRTQMNENAKVWALAEELSEMNHNAPLGYGGPPELVPMLHAIVLRHASMHPRIRLRVEITLEQLMEAGVSTEALEIPGASTLAQMLWAIQFGDFATYYLGVLRGANPSSMAALDRLKQRLAATPP